MIKDFSEFSLLPEWSAELALAFAPMNMNFILFQPL